MAVALAWNSGERVWIWDWIWDMADVRSGVVDGGPGAMQCPGGLPDGQAENPRRGAQGGVAR